MSSEWTETTLAVFADINPKRPIHKDTEAPFIEMAALPTYARDISLSDITNRVFKGGGAKFRNGDTLLARITPCLENGKTALVSGLDDSTNGHGSTEFIVLGAKSSIDINFLYYLSRSDLFRDYAIARMEGTSGRQRVPNSAVGEYQFLCPPPEDRKNIGDILSTLDDRIALLRETNTTLEAIAQALFKSWFVDFDPVRSKQEGREPEGMDADTAVLFPNNFEESELGLVPKGWRVKSLAELMDIAGGTQPPANEFIDLPRDGYIRLIQIRDYETDAHITYIPDTHKLRKTTKTDIMIARYGASVGRICWGLDGAYNVALVKVVCEENSREYLRTYLKSDVFQNRLDAVSGRSAQAGFNKSDIASFKLVIPPEYILALYQDIVWTLRSSVIARLDRIKTLATLRDTLLPRLISGQLRLPDAEALIEEATA